MSLGAGVLCLLGLLVFVKGQHSTNCGTLISKDGWRYDLTPITNELQTVNYTNSTDGLQYNINFVICGSLENPCGNNNLQSSSCRIDSGSTLSLGLFSLDEMHPLISGHGVQLVYYGGDTGQGNVNRTTYITIVCDYTHDDYGIYQLQADGFDPLYSIRFKSRAGCPAEGGFPPAFPSQYQTNKYSYTTDPKQGTYTVEILDSYVNKKLTGSTLLDSNEDTLKIFNWGDFDQFHNLSCYFLTTQQIALPFQLPSTSIYLAVDNEQVYDPVAGKFNEVTLEHWQYFVEGSCVIDVWFLPSTAIPVKELICGQTTIVFTNFLLGQPDGSLLKLNHICYPFNTCSSTYNTCKYPLCCSSGYTCQDCPFTHQ